MTTLTWNCCVWSFVLAVIATKESSQTQTSQNSLSSSEDQKQSYFFYQQSEYPRDCAEVLRRCPSRNASAVHAIKPDGFPGVSDAYCDSDGYTVIARRLDGMINFNRSWEDYTSGFGFLSNDFWLGNQRLSYLTNQKRYKLLIDVTLDNEWTIHATYDEFRNADAHSNFKLVSTGPSNIDGGWKYWTPWTPCSLTCGGGVRSRHSRCTKGAACAEDTEEEACNVQDCVVDGGWSGWSDWTECPVTCGRGQRVRDRECNNPAPQYGGRDCTGRAQQTQGCNAGQCPPPPVDGGWSEWSDWTECPVTCGGGQRVRDRECDNPAPRYGGRDCIGRAQQTQDCNTGQCPPPVHGGWSSWSDWTRCQRGCDPGPQRRRRACDSPVPRHGGRPCTGNTQEDRECLAVSCQGSTIRLADGPNSYSGRVEVYVDGAWGTACDDYFNSNTGNVACRQLGFAGGAASVHYYAHFGRGAGPIYYVYCTGSEDRLNDCYYFYRTNNCHHGEDSGVVCRR